MNMAIFSVSLPTKKRPFLRNGTVIECAIDGLETFPLCFRHHESADENGEEG